MTCCQVKGLVSGSELRESAGEVAIAFLLTTPSPVAWVAVLKPRNLSCNHCLGHVCIFSLVGWFATKCWGFHMPVDTVLWWIQENASGAFCLLFHFQSTHYSMFFTKIKYLPIAIPLWAYPCDCVCKCPQPKLVFHAPEQGLTSGAILKAGRDWLSIPWASFLNSLHLVFQCCCKTQWVCHSSQ